MLNSASVFSTRFVRSLTPLQALRSRPPRARYAVRVSAKPLPAEAQKRLHGHGASDPPDESRTTHPSSDDPYDHPKIDPRYLSTAEDIDDFVTCVRWARKIGEADALAEISAEEHRPGSEVQSDEEIAEYIRNHAVSGYHPTCTAKMGDDDLSVVDDDLRVHGLNSLRVIDASVMPQIPNAHLNAPTIAIAEKGADLLKEAQ